MRANKPEGGSIAPKTAEQAAAVLTLDLVGLAEAAELAGIGRAAFSLRRSRHVNFPKPVADLRCGPVWFRWQIETYLAEVVFAHPSKGTPLDPARLAREHLKPALAKAGIVKPFRPFHDLRHTALTHEAAAGNPLSYIQMKAGHSQTSITERYIHAAQIQFAGAAARAEERMFSSTAGTSV
jgi:integrase